jgi:hypothetical protein
METSNLSRRRGIKFLVGGLLGGTLLVVILSAAFHDWSYLGRWGTGLAAIVLVVVVTPAKFWLTWLAVSALSSITSTTRHRGKGGMLNQSIG